MNNIAPVVPGNRDTTRALALVLDNEFATFQAAAVALASSPALRLARDDAVAVLRAWAAEIARSLGGSAVVVNSAAQGHRQLLNTALPEGVALPSPSRPGEGAWDLIRRVVETQARRPTRRASVLGVRPSRRPRGRSGGLSSHVPRRGLGA